MSNLDTNLGLKEVLIKHDISDKVLRTKFSEAIDIVQATTSSEVAQIIPLAGRVIPKPSGRDAMPMDEILLKIVKKYGEKILLQESDRKPKTSKRKIKKKSSMNGIHKERHLEKSNEWEGTLPWDSSVWGDGCPKFLCDVMVRT